MAKSAKYLEDEGNNSIWKNADGAEGKVSNLMDDSFTS